MQKTTIDGNAIVYCEGKFQTPEGKTAHGLVRFTNRYNVLSVIDSTAAGQDAGMVLDRKNNGIPIYKTVEEAIEAAKNNGTPAKTLVIGLAPDGGRLPDVSRKHITTAIEHGLNVDSGLHDFLSEDENIRQLATEKEVRLRDIRKTPGRKDLHSFTGNIEKVDCLKIALLGTDSALGKRTTAWKLVQALQAKGKKAEMIGTGQTAWMQGAKYSFVLDSVINDFVAGELENAVYNAWKNEKPDVVVIEGQGSLLNPAYPGGFEILAAARPDFVVLQHAPTRKEYDGFPGYVLHPLDHQIKVMEMIAEKPVVAITINHENIPTDEIDAVCKKIEEETGLPTMDVLTQGAERLADVVLNAKKRKA